MAQDPVTEAAAGGSRFDAREHFRYLVDTPGFEPVYEAVFDRAVGATRAADGAVVVDFGEIGELAATPPAAPEDHAGWPAGFRALVARHGSLRFPDGGSQLLGEGVRFLPSYLKDSELAGRAADVKAPYESGMSLWLYHPTQTNRHGEPALCQLAQDDLEIGVPVELNAGALFLTDMAYLLELEIAIPDGRPTDLPTAYVLRAVDDVPSLGLDVRNERGIRYSISMAVDDPAGRHLLTLQGSWLAVHELADPVRPALIATLELPHAAKNAWLKEPRAEFPGPTDLHLHHSRGWVRIDLADPGNPTVTGFFHQDWCRATGLLSGSGVFFARKSGVHDDSRRFEPVPERDVVPSGNGYGFQPLDAPAEGIRILGPDHYGYHSKGSYADKDSARVGERLCFVGPDSLHTFESTDPAEPPRLVTQFAYDGGGTRLTAVPDERLLVLFELTRVNRHAVVTMDVSGRGKPKRVARLLKMCTAHAWTRPGNVIWLAVIDGRNTPRLARVTLGRTESTEELVAELPLDPRVLNKLVWMRVADGLVTLLDRTGELHAFSLA